MKWLIVCLAWCVCCGFSNEQLADAIYKAEGGAISKPYGIMKDYCKRGDVSGQCRKGCIQTIEHARKDWSGQGDFIAFLGSRYAPTEGATNDPTGLNSNWVKNVNHFLNKSETKI